MKNIHILSTDKPSRLYEWGRKELKFTDHPITNKRIWCQNIYITSDEEIKEGYYYDLTHNIVMKSIFYQSSDKNCKKIILTTDQDLIKDGVQAIDDEFLEWFVKNPSCEFVEVESVEVEDYVGFAGHTSYPTFHIEYKIIIPNIEHKGKALSEQEVMDNRSSAYNFIDVDKQETLEEVAKRILNNNSISDADMILSDTILKVVKSMVAMAKWQQEKSYSDMQEYATFCIECYRKEMLLLLVEDWYEHYKK